MLFEIVFFIQNVVSLPEVHPGMTFTVKSETCSLSGTYTKYISRWNLRVGPV